MKKELTDKEWAILKSCSWSGNYMEIQGIVGKLISVGRSSELEKALESKDFDEVHLVLFGVS